MIKQGKGFRTVKVLIASRKIIKFYYSVQKYLEARFTVSKLRDYPITCTWTTYAIADLFDCASSLTTRFQVNQALVKKKNKNKSNTDYFNNSQRISFWVPCQQKAGGLCHSFLSKPHFSNMADPSQSKHFLRKSEALQLNLPPWNREHSPCWETKYISHREDCSWREGVLSVGRPTNGMKQEDVRGKEERKMHVLIWGPSFKYTLKAGCVCPWDIKILI